MSDSDLHAIIADQAETIDQLRAELTKAQHSCYWESVYSDIRAAWDAWALAELGTSTPSQLDLAGRSELQGLWEAVK